MFDLLNGSLTLKTLAFGVPMMAMALGVASLGAHDESTPAAQSAAQSSRAAKVPSPEEAGVRAALEAYFQGHSTGLPDGFRRAFQPDARMLFVRDNKLEKMEIVDYIARSPGKPAADEAQRTRTIDFIDITGDAAVARLTLDYPDVKFTDYMTLLKINGEWRIVAKSFAADRRPAAARKSS